MDKRIAERILSLARDRGADAADVYLRRATASTVEVKDRAVDAFDRANDLGAGVRLIKGGRLGFAYTTDLGDAALYAVVDAAVASARNTEPDPFHVIPPLNNAVYPAVDIHDHAVPALSENEQIDRVLAMERAAFSLDPRVRRIRKASASFSDSEVLIASTEGAELSFRATAVSGSIEVVAEEGAEAQAGWEYEVKRFLRDVDLESVGRRAAAKAVGLLGARTIDSVKAPVILEATVAQEILDIIRSGFSAENVQKGKSLFAGKLGIPVASPLLTVCDDGLLAGGIGTAPADDEGIPASRKTVIDRGVLSLYLHNSRTAKKAGTNSTGNGIRGGFKSLPGVGIMNLYIQPGTIAPEEILHSTPRGLLVTEIMGAHTANAISGDFSVGATGFWIEQGRRAFPVRELTIAGNVIDVLKNVDAVCSDLTFSGRIGSPTLRISELSIGGR